MDVDVVPAGRADRHRVERRGIRLLQVLLRRLRKDDAEAECVVEAVALEHEDVVPRIGFLEEDGRVESRGPAADGDDLHRGTPAAFRSWPAMTSC
jgi:hypothetical protein